MAELYNKNLCDVPVDVIDAAIAALSQGEQETYRLGVCSSSTPEVSVGAKIVSDYSNEPSL